MLATTVIDRDAALEALRPAWEELLARSPQNHLYLTHDYLLAWWRALGAGAALRVITVADGERLLAAAPLMRVTGRLAGLPIRRLQSIGSGWGYGGLVLSERKAETLAELFAAIGRMRDWDLFYLPHLVPDPDLDAGALVRPAWERSVVHDIETTTIPHISLGQSFEGYLAARSSSFRRNVKNRERRLEKLGQTRYSRITDLARAGVPRETVLGWLRSVADRSWKADAGTAISSTPAVFEFYSQFADRLAARGALDLSLLFLDERPIAYAFGAIYENNYYEIDIAFDRACSEASPGVLLRNEILKRLCGSGLSRFDFIMNFDYKTDLTSEAADYATHLLYRRRPYPLFLRFLKRRLLPRLRARRAAGG